MCYHLVGPPFVIVGFRADDRSMAEGRIGKCTSITDYACLCQSSLYMNSVGVSCLFDCQGVELIRGRHAGHRAVMPRRLLKEKPSQPKHALHS